jgi:RNA polymerase sigma factor (sigma-70 family)
MDQKKSDWMKELREAVRIKKGMLLLNEDSVRTDSSLLRQVKTLSNARGWTRFYETYAPMIARFALRSNLSPAESQDVVQTTMIHLAKTIPQFDPERGKFKSFLFTCAKWRIMDLHRARPKNTVDFQLNPAALEAKPSFDSWDPNVSDFEKIWDEEWEQQIQREALEQVKKRVSGTHFQIFCLYVLEELPAAKVAEMVGVRVAQVHLVRCRVGRLVKKELAALHKK